MRTTGVQGCTVFATFGALIHASMATAKKTNHDANPGFFNPKKYGCWMFPANDTVKARLQQAATVAALFLLSFLPASAQSNNRLTLIAPGYVAFTYQGDTLDTSQFAGFFTWIGVQDAADAKKCAARSLDYLLATQAPDSLDNRMLEVWKLGLRHYAVFSEVEERKPKIVKATKGLK